MAGERKRLGRLILLRTNWLRTDTVVPLFCRSRPRRICLRDRCRCYRRCRYTVVVIGIVEVVDLYVYWDTTSVGKPFCKNTTIPHVISLVVADAFVVADADAFVVALDDADVDDADE